MRQTGTNNKFLLTTYLRFLFQLVLFFLLGQKIAEAQNVMFDKKAGLRMEAGLPFIQNFKPKDIHALPQTTAIIQDRREVMYFGNNAGVLEYDGSNWRLIKLPGLSEANALTIDQQGQIFVGGDSELGYLKPDENGQLRYISLLKYVPAANRKFGHVWNAQANSEGIFFETLKGLIRLQKNVTNPDDSASWQCKIWQPEKSFYRLHSVKNQIFVSLPHKLMELRGDSLHLVLDHREITKATINLMLPYSEKAIMGKKKRPVILVGTRYEGLFLFNGSSLKPFKSEAGAYLRKNALYHGARLADGRYALATLWGGVVVIDHQGNLLRIVNKTAGLHNENILFVFPDREEGLWLGTDNGISRIETSSAISFFDEALGLNGGVYTITRDNGRLYFGTSSGLAYLSKNISPGLPSSIKFVPKMKTQIRALLSLGSTLLAGGINGIYQVDENNFGNLISRYNPNFMLRSKKNPKRIYCSLLDGLAILQIKNSKVQPLLRLPKISGDMRLLAEDDNGVLWAGGYPQSLWRIELPDYQITQANLSDVKIESFSSKKGLPKGWVMPYRVRNRIIFATSKGLRRFDDTTRTFKIDSSLGVFFADTSHVFHTLVEDSDSLIWMVHSYKGRDEIGYAAKRVNGTYDWNSNQLYRINEFGYISMIFVDPLQPGVTWFACQDALVRYDRRSAHAPADNFSTLLRRVTINGDSLLYGGAGSVHEPDIKYSYNTLEFEYSGLSYDLPAATQYQYYLEGFEKGWSDWVKDTKKEYTNIPEGKYHFHVRAKDAYSRVSKEAGYIFSIMPPWYRTWWAYLIYLLIAVSGITILLQWRVATLNKKSEQLERIIEKRTQQVKEQKSRLEQQAQQLQKMDKVKSLFFANISHEFRTPITIIILLLEKVLNGTSEYNTIEETKVMHRNANSLLQLVNQLLDLSKLEFGKMLLRASEGDIVPFLKNIIDSFAPLAKIRNINIHLHTSVRSLTLWFDRNHLETVIYNVIMNAMKFTADGGKIDVIIEKEEISKSLSSKKNGPTDFAKIYIKDNGIGIPADELPHIFDRFYQANSGHTNLTGTGIGLSLVKELVELHQGSVEIMSQYGEGTELMIKLPLGKDHLKPEEIQPMGSDNGSIEDKKTLPVIHESANKPPKTDEISPAVKNKFKILLVEDNADMRIQIRKALQSAYHIVEAENGVEGVSKAFKIIPDLIISDVMMPSIDGYQLCEKLKNDERTSHIPIILLTAKAEQEDKLSGLDKGADDYLIKPFDMRELKVRINNLIAIRIKMQKKFQKHLLMHPTDIPGNSKDDIFIKKVIAVIQEHLEDESFTPTDLAKTLNMSRAQFYRKIKAMTDQSAGYFIRLVRLQHAAVLLQRGDDSITEIAYKVGFSSNAYFSKCFKEQFGMSPKKYRQKYI